MRVLASGEVARIPSTHHFNRAQSLRGPFAIRDQADFTLALETTSTRDVLRLTPDKWRHLDAIYGGSHYGVWGS